MDSYLSSVAARSNPRTARFLFSSSGNSPSGRHFTLVNLLCITLQVAVYSRLLEKASKKYKKIKILLAFSVKYDIIVYALQMRVQFNGRTPAFQAGYVGSIPITRLCDSGVVGNARPCQGRDRGFEPRLSLFTESLVNPVFTRFFLCLALARFG